MELLQLTYFCDAAETENFEEFLQTLESKYGFKVGPCYWMYTPALIERNFNF